MKYDLTANERLKRAVLAQPPAKKRRGELSPASPVYLLGGLLFAAVSLSGLFAGFFLDAPLGKLIAGGEPILHGSLLGVIVEVVRGSIPLPARGDGLLGIFPLLFYGMSIALACTVLCELALAAVSFAHAKSARRICFFNGALAVTVYGALFLGGLVCGALTGTPATDLSVAAVLSSAAALLLLLTLARRGLAGIMAGSLFCCSLASFGVLCTGPFPALLDALAGGTFDVNGILASALCAVLAAGLVCAFLRLGKRALCDLARYSVQLLLSLALCAVLLRGGNMTLSSAAFLLLPPIAGVLLSALSRMLFPAKRPAAPQEKEADSLAAGPMQTSL